MFNTHLKVLVSCLILGSVACETLRSNSGVKMETDSKQGAYKPPEKEKPDTPRLIQKKESDLICNESKRLQQQCDDGSLFNEPPLMTSTSIIYCLSLKESGLSYECMVTLVGSAIPQERLVSCDQNAIGYYEMLECLEKLTKE